MGALCSSSVVEPTERLSTELAQVEKRLLEMELFGPIEMAQLRAAFCACMHHAQQRRARRQPSPAPNPEDHGTKNPEKEDPDEVECTLSECCDWLGFGRTLFSDRCFRLANGGGDRVNFASFVATIWLVTAHDLATLSFWMTDEQGKGYLDISDIQSIMTSVKDDKSYVLFEEPAKYDKHSGQFVKVQRLFAQLDTNYDGRITHDQWCDNIQLMHNALMPAFSLQRLIHRRVFKNSNVDLAAIEKARRMRREELSSNFNYGAGAGMTEVLNDLSGLFPDLECAICLELLYGEEFDDGAPRSSAYHILPGARQGTITTLPCSHRFHTHCMETLRMHMEVSQACPLCRSELPISEQTRAPGSEARGLLAHRGRGERRSKLHE